MKNKKTTYENYGTKLETGLREQLNEQADAKGVLNYKLINQYIKEGLSREKERRQSKVQPADI